MTGHNENFSDLNVARHLAKRIRGGEPADETPNWLRQGTGYVRFQMPDPDVPVAAPSQPRPVPTPNLTADLFGATGWSELLEWAIEAFDGQAALVIDGDGFVVAYRGDLPIETFEAIGARLTVALDQARQMQTGENEAPSINIEYGDGWICGFAMSFSNVGLIVAMLSRSQLGKEFREAICTAVSRVQGKQD